MHDLAVFVPFLSLLLLTQMAACAAAEDNAHSVVVIAAQARRVRSMSVPADADIGLDIQLASLPEYHALAEMSYMRRKGLLDRLKLHRLPDCSIFSRRIKLSCRQKRLLRVRTELQLARSTFTSRRFPFIHRTVNTARISNSATAVQIWKNIARAELLLGDQKNDPDPFQWDEYYDDSSDDEDGDASEDRCQEVAEEELVSIAWKHEEDFMWKMYFILRDGIPPLKAFAERRRKHKAAIEEIIHSWEQMVPPVIRRCLKWKRGFPATFRMVQPGARSPSLTTSLDKAARTAFQLKKLYESVKEYLIAVDEWDENSRGLRFP